MSGTRSFSRSMRSSKTVPCSVRRSSDGRRIRWNRRNRQGLRPWISGKWMTVRVHFRATSTGQGSGRWASGTSTPSGTTVTLVEQRATPRRIAPTERARGSTARVSTGVKARAPGGTRATGTRSVPLLRQGGAQACRVLEVLEGPSEPDSRRGRAGGGGCGAGGVPDVLDGRPGG